MSNFGQPLREKKPFWGKKLHPEKEVVFLLLSYLEATQCVVHGLVSSKMCTDIESKYLEKFIMS